MSLFISVVRFLYFCLKREKDRERERKKDRKRERVTQLKCALNLHLIYTQKVLINYVFLSFGANVACSLNSPKIPQLERCSSGINLFTHDYRGASTKMHKCLVGL